MTKWIISFEGESIAMEQLFLLGKALAPFNARIYSSEPAFTNCTHIIGLMMLPKGWDVIEHGETSFTFNYCPKCGAEL